MALPQYNLRWNNHQRHLFTVFESLLQTESLVDVTLVCEDASVKAHKMILSACSPYFAKIFEETPGKHPTVVLNNMMVWEMQCLVDFMYRGEVSVDQERLAELMKAAESLQIQGLTACEKALTNGKGKSEGDSQPPSPSSPHIDTEFDIEDDLPPSDVKLLRSDVSENNLFGLNGSRASPASSESSHLNMRSSPTPRRKQARPQRRREESPLLTASFEDDPLPLELKKDKYDASHDSDDDMSVDNDVDCDKEPRNLTLWQGGDVKIDVDDRPAPGNGLKQEHGRNHYPSTPPALVPHSTRSGPKMLGVGGATMHGGVPMFSAPRGGPPRHWSNENLTEALRNVWSGRMKTAQASRVFGIPYNSLLMYVRGKYGKSLKLDLIRKGEIPSHLASEPFNIRTPSLAPYLGPPQQGPPSESQLSLSRMTMLLDDMRSRGKHGEHARPHQVPLNGPSDMPPIPFFPSDPALRSLGMLNNLLTLPHGVPPPFGRQGLPDSYQPSKDVVSDAEDLSVTDSK